MDGKHQLPNQTRFRLYAKRLAMKGWTEEDICARARIPNRRWPRLSKGLMKPQLRELSRLRGLMKLPVPGKEEEARAVWRKKEGWPRPSPESKDVSRPTVRGLDLLLDVSSHQGERGFPVTKKGDKVVARKLVKDWLLEEVSEDSGLYKITDKGRYAIREFSDNQPARLIA